MAILTWKNVPVPDLASASQEGVRTAGQMLERALGHASAGVGQLQQVEAQRLAAEKEAADRFVLQNMLAIQDPAKYREALASGQVVGPAQARVSPEMLLRAEARQDFLQSRADLDTARSDADYARTRSRDRDGKLDAAQSYIDQALGKATYSPQEAQRLAAQANLAPEDQLKLASTLSGLYKDTSGHQAASRAAKQDALDQKAISLADRIRSLGANPEAAGAMLRAEKDPTVRFRAEEILKKFEGPDRVAQYAGSRPGFDLPLGQSAVAPELRPVLQKAKEAIEAPLPADVQVIANAANNPLSIDQAGVSIAKKLGDDSKVGEATQMVKELIDQVRSEAKIDITAAEAEASLLSHAEQEGFEDFDDLKDGVDVREGKALQFAKDIQSKRDYIKGRDRRKAKYDKVVALEAEVLRAAAEAEAQAKLAGQSPSAREAAEKSRDKAQRMQEKLNAALADLQDPK